MWRYLSCKLLIARQRMFGNCSRPRKTWRYTPGLYFGSIRSMNWWLNPFWNLRSESARASLSGRRQPNLRHRRSGPCCARTILDCGVSGVHPPELSYPGEMTRLCVHRRSAPGARRHANNTLAQARKAAPAGGPIGTKSGGSITSKSGGPIPTRSGEVESHEILHGSKKHGIPRARSPTSEL